jgi:hypothetical protein
LRASRITYSRHAIRMSSLQVVFFKLAIFRIASNTCASK